MALIHVENATVERLLQDPAFRAEFPFIASRLPALPASNCAPCQQRKYREQLDLAMNDIKIQLANLEAAQRARVKEFLNAKPEDKLRFQYKMGKSVVQVTA